MQRSSGRRNQNSLDLAETQVLSIPGCGFHPKDNTHHYLCLDSLLGHYTSSSGTGIYHAPLHLPDQSIINKISFHYYDPAEGADGNLSLFKVVLSVGAIPGSAKLADLSSSGSEMYGTVSTASGFSQLIENSNYDYYFTFTAPDGVSIGLPRVEVEYTLPSDSSVYEYLDLPPAGFVPYSDDLEYRNFGWYADNNSTTTPVHLQAPVLLPDGALVHAGWFYYYDNNAAINVRAHLHRTDLAGSWDPSDAMADFESFETNQYSVSAVALTKYTRIDNSKYAYWIYYELPASAELPPVMGGRGHVIRFKNEQVYPLRSISIPAAAFSPKTDGQVYANHGRYLESHGVDNIYIAPLYLEEGKTIRRVKFYYERKGSPTTEAVATLIESTDLGGYPLSELTSSGTGWRYTDSGLLHDLVVDNQHHSYTLEWKLPESYTSDTHVLPSGVVIEIADGDDLLFIPIVRN